MRSAARTLGAAAPAAVVVAAAWLRFEQPLTSLGRAALLVVLALATALVPGRALRAAAVLVAAVLAASLSVGVWLLPQSLSPADGFGLGTQFATFGSRFGGGFLDFYATHLPFDPRIHVEMTHVTLVAVFCFALLVAQLAASRKPVAAALAVLLGAGWPATLLGPSYGIAMGAAILAAVLLVLAALGARRLPRPALPAAAVVVLGAVVVGSATAARHGPIHWQSWDPARAAAKPTSVSFVWNAQYGGITWPKKRTVVLHVQSNRQPSYLRAAVLDDFAGDAWQMGTPRASDSLEPAAALRPANQTREIVTIDALSDTQLVGGSVPMRFAVPAPVSQPERGFADLPEGTAQGFHYTVWSYSPDPSPAALSRSRPDYPRVLLRNGLLGVGGGVDVQPFGVPHRRDGLIEKVASNPVLYPYLPLARLAFKLTRGAKTPYAAVADLERWFLVDGGFRYSDHPEVVAPPLVGFVTITRAGYCQYFAGAMALMLRYLGIPSRVAVGFGGGTLDPSTSNDWVYTDRDAHAWVEVWFRGYGWLPFDPTPPSPGSSRLPVLPGTGGKGSGVAGSSEFRQRGSSSGGTKPSAKGGVLSVHAGQAEGEPANGKPGGGGFPAALVVLLVVAGLVGAIAAVKQGVRLRRRLPRDPRRVSAACREELAAFLVDQRIDPARSATLRELGELVRGELGVDPGAFVAAASAARFGPSARADIAARDARRELPLLLAACRRALTRHERVLGFLSLRSLARPRPVEASVPAGSGIAGTA